jgi:hypothetical protein
MTIYFTKYLPAFIDPTAYERTTHEFDSVSALLSSDLFNCWKTKAKPHEFIQSKDDKKLLLMIDYTQFKKTEDYYVLGFVEGVDDLGLPWFGERYGVLVAIEGEIKRREGRTNDKRK